MNLFRMKIFFLMICCAVLSGLLCPPSSEAEEQFVAVIVSGDLPRYRTAHTAFMERLHQGGLMDGRVKVYVQTPNPDPLSLANSVRKAVAVGADLIVTYGAPATLVAKKESRGIPILFADVYDPVGLGIVKSLGAPGGEISGVSGKTPLATLIKIFVEVRPVREMGVLYSSDDKSSVYQVEELEHLAAQYGFALVKKDVTNPKTLPAALSAFSGKVDSLFVAESAILCLGLKKIVDHSMQNNLPVGSQIPGLSDLGGLITLETDPAEQGELAGTYALQILTGTQAHTLPIRTPKKVSLVINLQSARKMHLTISFQALSMATRVIK